MDDRGRLDLTLDDHARREDPYLRPPHHPLREPIPIRRWLLFLAIGLLVFEFVFSPRGMIALARARRAVKMATVRRVAAEAETARLAELRAQLESGNAVESTARETYGMARPGEEIYVLPAPESQKERP
ncbi:MAG TPA: septum formation initiator family protein [Candidatus Udaeobacter sp.]|nr:septum formation initiator family protein [Candidatus Udaeobacter sp.]